MEPEVPIGKISEGKKLVADLKQMLPNPKQCSSIVCSSRRVVAVCVLKASTKKSIQIQLKHI